MAFVDLNPTDLASIRAGLTAQESARFNDEQIEACWQYQRGLPDHVAATVAILKDRAARQKVSAETAARSQHNAGKLRAQWIDPPKPPRGQP